MFVRQDPIDLDDINRVIQKVAPHIADEHQDVACAALLAMVVMAQFPHLEGDALISAVESASQLLVSLPTATSRAS